MSRVTFHFPHGRVPIFARLTMTNEDGSRTGEILTTTDCVVTDTGVLEIRFASVTAQTHYYTLETWYREESNGSYPYYVTSNRPNFPTRWGHGPYDVEND